MQFNICMRFIAIVLAATATIELAYLMLRSDDYQCSSRRRTTMQQWHDFQGVGKPLTLLSQPFNPMKNIRHRWMERDEMELAGYMPRQQAFDLDGRDVLVFLHMQKTGGTTLGRNLVKNLVSPGLRRLCKCQMGRKRCQCLRPSDPTKQWLFSRYSTGWRCGLHADFTELSNCVDPLMDEQEKDEMKRRYFYITLLRDPYRRYLSEFLHVQRGATWRTSRHWCGGRAATTDELPACYQHDTWEGVALDDFLTCKHNLANNRMTRMLADLSLVGCYNMSYMPPVERSVVLLASAKANLQRMAFFGIVERFAESQYVFESTFDNLRFSAPLLTNNITHTDEIALTETQRRRILQLNHLDVELYRFALNLFDRRVRRFRAIDADRANVTDEEE